MAELSCYLKGNGANLPDGDMETWRHGDMETWRHGDTLILPTAHGVLSLTR